MQVNNNSFSSSVYYSLITTVKSAKNFVTSLPQKVQALWIKLNSAENRYFDRNYGYWAAPVDEKKTDAFGKLMVKENQREHWFRVTPYVAEFCCTISSAGFLIVGFRHKSLELVLAGCASIASHAVPKNWLLAIDKIGAGIAVLKLARTSFVFVQKPWLIVPAALVGVIFAADTFLADKSPHTLSHIAWHLSAAGFSELILRNGQ